MAINSNLFLSDPVLSQLAANKATATNYQGVGSNTGATFAPRQYTYDPNNPTKTDNTIGPNSAFEPAMKAQAEQDMGTRPYGYGETGGDDSPWGYGYKFYGKDGPEYLGETDEAKQSGGDAAFYAQNLYNPQKEAWDVNEGGTSVSDAQRDRTQYLDSNLRYSDMADEAGTNASVMRYSQLEGLDALKRYATGQDSMVARQAALDADTRYKQYLSQMAGQKYNPYMQRALAGQLSDTNLSAARTSELAAAQEKAAAMQAWLGQGTQIRGMDAEQYKAELARQAAERAWIGQREQLGQAWEQMGMTDKWNQATSAQNLERYLSERDLNYLRSAMGQQASSNSQDAQYGQAVGSAIGTGVGLMGAIASMFSDAEAKQNISPVTLQQLVNWSVKR